MNQKDVVKALRICAKGCMDGGHCPYKGLGRVNKDCYAQLMNDAAELIESYSRKPRYHGGMAEIHMTVDTKLLSIRDKLLFFDWSGMKQGEIAKALSVTQHGISYHMKELEEQGFHVIYKRREYHEG